MKKNVANHKPYGSQKFETTEQYFAAQSEAVIPQLSEMRRIVRKAAPMAVEVISYNMPALKHNRIIVYYAAAKNHIGFYPTAAPIKAFASELKNYKTSKGAVQFPLNKKLPAALISKMVTYRVKEINTISKPGIVS